MTQLKSVEEELPEFMKHEVRVYRTEDVIKRVRKAIEAQKKVDKKMESCDLPHVSGRYIVYNQSSIAGPQIRDYLENIGCPLAELIDEPGLLFSRLRAVRVTGIVFWYSYDHKMDTEVLRDVLEAREFPRYRCYVVCPSEEQIENFKKEHPDLYVDGIFTRPENRGLLEDAMLAGQNEVENLESSREALFKMREVNRQIMRGQTVDFNATHHRDLAVQLNSEPGKQYWVDTETVLFELVNRQTDRGLQLATQLVKSYPKSFLVKLIFSSAIMQKSGSAPAAKWLLESIQDPEILNSERAFRVGRLLLRWKNKSALRVFLNYWYRANHLENDFVFEYFVGQYLRLMQDYEMAQKMLRSAVVSQPTNWDVIEGLAITYERQKLYTYAEQFWVLATQFEYGNELANLIGSFRCLDGQRRVRKAEAMLKYISDKYPDNKKVKKLEQNFFRKRIFDSNKSFVSSDQPVRKKA